MCLIPKFRNEPNPILFIPGWPRSGNVLLRALTPLLLEVGCSVRLLCLRSLLLIACFCFSLRLEHVLSELAVTFESTKIETGISSGGFAERSGGFAERSGGFPERAGLRE